MPMRVEERMRSIREEAGWPDETGDLHARCLARNIICEKEVESIDFSGYTDNPTERRQLFWLAYTTSAIGRHFASGARLLDIGSNIQWVSGVASVCDVTMVDFRPHPLKDLFPFALHTANATGLPFSDATFDVVTFPQLLHWVGTSTYGDAIDVDGDRASMSEISRVLKPGGIGIFTTFVLPDRTVFKVGGRRLLSFDDLVSLVEGSGFGFVELSLHRNDCRAISRNEIPPRSNRILVPGNPDEDLAWAVCTIRRHGTPEA